MLVVKKMKGFEMRKKWRGRDKRTLAYFQEMKCIGLSWTMAAKRQNYGGFWEKKKRFFFQGKKIINDLQLFLYLLKKCKVVFIFFDANSQI